MLPIRGLKSTAIRASLHEASAKLQFGALRVKSQGILTLLFALMSRDPFGCGLGADADPHPPRLERSNLLLYRNSNGEVRPVKSVRDWQKRRAEIRRAMEEVMGPLPGKGKRCPLDVHVEEEVDGGDYVRRFLTYAS